MDGRVLQPPEIDEWFSGIYKQNQLYSSDARIYQTADVSR